MIEDVGNEKFSQNLKKLIGDEMLKVETFDPVQITAKFNELITTLEWFKHSLLHNMEDVVSELREVEKLRDVGEFEIKADDKKADTKVDPNPVFP